MRYSLKYLLFFLLLGGNLPAQQYYFERISVEEGLSQASIYAVLEDSRGNMWFATESGGVNMYDGQEIKYYFKNQGLPDDNIRTMYEDSKGRIWFGTANGGAAYYENDTFHTLNIDNGLPENYVKAITEDGQGRIWIGTLNNGIAIYDKGKFDYYPRKRGLLSDGIRALIKDHLGQVWVGTDHGLSVFKNKRFHHYTMLHGMPNNSVISLFEDKDHNIWVGTESGVCYFNGKEFTSITENDGLSDSRVSTIFQDKEGNMWFGSKRGVDKWNYSDFKSGIKSFVSFNESNGLSNNRVLCITQDCSGSVWIGTKFGGVNKYIGEKFVNYSVFNGLSDQVITSLCTMKNGTIAFGTFSNGITLRNGRSYDYINEMQGLFGVEVTALAEDQSGALWIGTDGSGIYNYYKGQLSSFSPDFGDEVNCLFTDSRGLLWMGANRGLRCISAQKGAAKYSVDAFQMTSYPTYEKNKIYSICEDHAGRIWATSDSGVIMIPHPEEYNNPKIEMRFLKDLPVEDNASIISCVVDKSGQKIWFGTQGSGIFFCYKDKFYPLQGSNDLDNLIINSISLGKNQLWLGTNKDVRMISLNDYAMQTYSFKDGFNGIQCNRNASCVDVQGNLWIGTINGTCKIDINRASQIPVGFTPPLQLTQIKFNYSTFDWRPYCDSLTGFYNIPNKLDLPYDINTLSFDFKAKGLINPSDVEYRFYLKGQEDSLAPPTHKNEVTYSNLDPGEYDFIVYARLKNGKWSDKPIQFHITINAPFWATTWFRVSAVVLIFILLFAGFRWRTRRLIHEKKKLEEVVKARTIDLEQEKHKSESLLLNILPEEIADELKLHGVASTKLYPLATVMFTDFAGFTSLSGKLTPNELVGELSTIFTQFDEITDRHNMEKIKTIGDAYMCAGGIPVSNETHPVDAVLAAFDFIAYIDRFNKELNNGHTWGIRAGLHTGPIIAGVVGKKKFAYDIWGDSVNIASRMESNSEEGKVNISESTYELIKDYFVCTPRGEKHVKNKGEMLMYFVERLLPEYSKDDEGWVPNEKLYQQISSKRELS
ncbi:MAG: two-component regulator propeller domain-containing protein [Flavobacteriales bacterium]